MPFATVTPQGTATLIQTTAATAVVTAPAGMVAGELLVLALTNQNQPASADWTLPSGWVRFGTPWIVNDAGQRGDILAYHVVTSADVTAQAGSAVSWAFTYPSGSGREAGWCRRFSGVDTTTPDAGHSAGKPTIVGNVVTLVSFTVAVDNAYLLVMANNQLVSPNAASVSVDSGMTQQALVSSLAGADNTTVTRTLLGVFTKALGTAGASPTPAVTWPASTGVGMMSVALRPASISNVSPTASFTHTETGLTTSVNGSGSSDSDGSITGYDWNWGDSTTHATTASASHSYAAPGTYTITLTVTDNLGATGTTSATITVSTLTDSVALADGAGGTTLADVWIADGAGGKKQAYVYRVGSGIGTPTNLVAKSGFVVGHMGASYDEPDGAMEGVTKALMWGADALMLSLARTSDGHFILLNDTASDGVAYLDRMTLGVADGKTLDPRTLTLAQIQASYDMGSYWTGLATSSPRRPWNSLEQVLAAYPGVGPIMIDPKAIPSTYYGAILDIMDANGGPSRFIAKYYITGAGWRTAAKARNAAYKTWGYGYGANMGVSEDWPTLAPQWDWLGLDIGTSQANWTTALSYGKPVIGHIATSKAMYDTGMSKGASGIMAAAVREILWTPYH
jgi:PKD repeat protein